MEQMKYPMDILNKHGLNNEGGGKDNGNGNTSKRQMEAKADANCGEDDLDRQLAALQSSFTPDLLNGLNNAGQ
jgi:hypothetical protein